MSVLMIILGERRENQDVRWIVRAGSCSNSKNCKSHWLCFFSLSFDFAVTFGSRKWEKNHWKRQSKYISVTLIMIYARQETTALLHHFPFLFLIQRYVNHDWFPGFSEVTIFLHFAFALWEDIVIVASIDPHHPCSTKRLFSKKHHERNLKESDQRQASYASDDRDSFPESMKG